MPSSIWSKRSSHSVRPPSSLFGGDSGSKRWTTLRLVELRCAPAALERRLEDVSREQFGKLRDAKRYHEMEAAGVFSRPIMPPAEIVVETTDVTPAEAARLIAAQLLRPPPG